MAETIVSPGVFTRENDLSFLPQGIGAIGACIIGPTVKGPVGIPTLVTTYSEYQNVFGTTVESGSGQYTYLTSISAFNYLFMLDGIFLWIALFFGLAAPLIINFMTQRSLKIFSTQSATGLLYINIVLILMSELIFKFYLFKYNLVL